MRDNALAVALRAQGHDAMMVPLYLPPALDEASSAENVPLFYGGINVYLQQKVGFFRKTPRWIDKLFDSPSALKSAASRAGMTQAHELGDMTLSMLQGEDGKQAKELTRLSEWLTTDGKADVICLSNALLMGLAGQIKRETGALVACTLQGEDTFLDSLNEPYRTQSWETIVEKAKDVDIFIAVSKYHADLMIDRAKLPPDRVHVVYNGIRLEGYGPHPAPKNDPPILGYLARMCPPKGLTTLVQAYILLRKRGTIPNLQLHIAGAQTAADIPYVETLKLNLDGAGLANDVRFLPNIGRGEKIAFLQSLAALSVPATYGESFGLYILEALAAGVPVVQPRHAVFPELLAVTGGGILCEPDDPESLANTLESLLQDRQKAHALGEAGRQTILTKFSVEEMARNVATVFK